MVQGDGMLRLEARTWHLAVLEVARSEVVG